MGADTDRVKNELITFIRKAIGFFIISSIDYLGAFPCKAIVQNSDGTLELRPDDSRLPPYKNVPIRYGVPGVSATISPGGRVILEFTGGDPQKPIATVWESATVTLLTITSTQIKLGGSASQALVLGTSYATHMTALATALQTLSNAITPLMLPPAAAAAKAAALLAYNAATQLAGDISAQNTTQ